MRRLFIDQESIAVKRAVRQRLEDHDVLVAMHCSFLSSSLEVVHLARAKGISHRIKKALELVGKHLVVQDKKAEVHAASSSNSYESRHSCSGQVIAIGDRVSTVRTGDYVACVGEQNAQFGDLLRVSEFSVVRINKQENLTLASLSGVGAQALHALRQAQVGVGERVGVIGLGLLGQLTAQLAKRAGCFVVGTDLVEERIQIAKQCGADVVFHALAHHVQNEIFLLTENQGLDAVFIAAASLSAEVAYHALSLVRERGRIIILGSVPLALDESIIRKKEIEIIIVHGAGPSNKKDHPDYGLCDVRWTSHRNLKAFVDLVEQKALQLAPLISEEVTLESLGQIYTRIKEKKVIAAILHYQQKDIRMEFLPAVVAPATDNNFAEVRPHKDTFVVAVMGVHACEKSGLMSSLEGQPGVVIGAISEHEECSKVLHSSRFSSVPYCLTEEELFESKTDMLVISSTRPCNTTSVLQVLAHGKAVLSEHPFARNQTQFEDVKTFLAAHPHVPFCMNFYRSFSPFIRKIKGVVEKRTTPLMISYRMNSPYRWDESNSSLIGSGGKIIGQFGHLIDVCMYLTDARPLSVSVESLHAARSDIFPTDNCVAQISFSDGSVCSLLYTSQGHGETGLERMELFFDGKSIIMDDFVGLYGFGLPSWFNETVSRADRGQAWLLESFLAACRQEKFVSPIPFDRLVTTMQLTYTIDQLACEGGGAQPL